MVPGVAGFQLPSTEQVKCSADQQRPRCNDITLQLPRSVPEVIDLISPPTRSSRAFTHACRWVYMARRGY